jgi:hypothetical protein
MNFKGRCASVGPFAFGCAFAGQAAAYFHLQLHLQFDVIAEG